MAGLDLGPAPTDTFCVSYEQLMGRPECTGNWSLLNEDVASADMPGIVLHGLELMARASEGEDALRLARETDQPPARPPRPPSTTRWPCGRCRSETSNRAHRA